MKAYVLINVRTGDINDVIRHLQRLEGVVDANMVFGPYDIVAVVEAGDIHQIGALLAAGIQPIPGVLETLTCLAIND